MKAFFFSELQVKTEGSQNFHENFYASLQGGYWGLKLDNNTGVCIYFDSGSQKVSGVNKTLWGCLLVN